VGKLARDYFSNLRQTDIDIVDEFDKNPRLFLDYDPHLALDLKRLYEKRVIQNEERAKMGVRHIA
jgi:hypothetical protein